MAISSVAFGADLAELLPNADNLPTRTHATA